MKNSIEFESLYDTLFLHRNKIGTNTLGLTSIAAWKFPIFFVLLILAAAMLSGAGLMMAMLGIGDLNADEMAGHTMTFMFLTIIGASFVSVLIQASNTRNKEKIKIKNGIVAPLISGINPGCKYNIMNFVPQNIFESSEIFGQKISSYKGNDLAMGKVEENYIMFSDLLVKNFTHTVFYGQFIVTEFNKSFEGRTVVSTDYAEALLGNVLGGLFQSSAGDKHLIKMDSPEFEKSFVVHASDKVEARYILTPSLMEYILNYQKMTKRHIQISFVKNAVCIAVPNNKDNFEDNFPIGELGPSLKKEFDEEFVKPLELATGVIKELKLNERLWK